MSGMKKTLVALAVAHGLAAGAVALAQAGPAAAFDPDTNVVRVDRVRLIALERAGSRIVAAGERGRILISDDEGKTWTVADVPTRNTLTSLYFVDAKFGFATGHQGTLLRTEDGGKTWRQAKVEMKEKSALFAIELQGERGIAVGSYGAYLESSDGGRSWTERHIGPEGFDRHLTGIAAIGPGKFIVAGEQGSLLRSVDGGAKWELLKPPYEGSYFGAVGLKDGSAIAYGMRGNAYRSADGGATWQKVDLGAYKGALQFGVEFADGSVVLAGTDGMIATSTDLGKTFAAAPLPDRRPVSSLLRTADGNWLTAGPRGLRPAQ